MTDELPDTQNAPTLASEALDWSVLFEKHYRNAFQAACIELPASPKSEDFQGAAAQALISTLRESGMEDSALIKVVGEAIWGAVKIKEDWTEEKNLRRTDLIDKMFQDTLTFEERFELNSLTWLMRAALETEANIPVAGAKKLYSELLEMDGDE